MKFFLLALVSFICADKTYGQADSSGYGEIEVVITKEKNPKKISTKVLITSTFPGGDSSFIRSIEQELDQTIPFKNGAKPGKYIVGVRFIIDKEGNIAEILCSKDPGFRICEPVRSAIFRYFRKRPRWTPATEVASVKPYRTSAIIFPPSSLKYKMDSVRKNIPYPSDDLLPPEFTASALRNEYYAESDSMSFPTFYRGHVFLLTLRSNCTFIYETFYKPYSYTRIEFLTGRYKISGDTVLLSYESLLPGKAGKTYLSPTTAVSWKLPPKPDYLLVGKKGFSEPFEQRLKKTASYVQIEGAQFDLEPTKCWKD